MQPSDKDSIREQVLAQRPLSSAGLFSNLVRIAIELDAHVIASYSPQPTEPNVFDFNDWVQATGRTLLLPRVKGESLEFASGELVLGKFGLLEPSGLSQQLEDLDLILVPALAVDRSGNRLGKGKGFYDRVLGALSCPKFAIVFDGEIFEQLPAEPHDQKVQGAISPSAISYF